MSREAKDSWVNLNSIIAHTTELEPLAPAITRLVGLLAASDPDMREVERTMSFDPTIVLRVVGAANSVVYGGKFKARTVGEALLRLGTGPALNLIMSSAARKQMTGGAPAYRMREMDLWTHSVATAVAVEVGAKRGWPGFTPAAFTAALIHDIGKVLLAKHMEADLVELLERAERETSQKRAELEAEILGVHHGEVGGLIAQHWKMPEDIVCGVTQHHSEAETKPLCVAIRAANLIAKRALGIKQAPQAPEDSAILQLELDQEACAIWCAETGVQVRQVAGLYGITLPDGLGIQNGEAHENPDR